MVQQQYEELTELYCRTRDIELRNQLLDHYSYIAKIAAKKFAGRGVEYDDLFQIASLALLKALERYDCSRNIQFGSFATPSVIGEIKNYFRDKSRLIRLPRRQSELLKQLRETQQKLTAENGHAPSSEELAASMGISVELVYELLETGYSVQPVSLDGVLNAEEGDASISDFIGVEATEYGQIEDADFLKRSLAQLSDMEHDILKARFLQGKSQRQVAEDLGVSQMYVSRLERKTLAKLREKL